MQEITKKTKISKLFTASSGSNPYGLIALPTFTRAGYRMVEFYHEIENLVLLNQVMSLPQITIPEFELDVDDSTRKVALLNLQWKSARIHFNLYLDDGQANRQLLKTYSLLTPKPYPYAEISLGDYPLGSNTNLYGAIQSAGYGLLQGNDKVYINGDLISHYYVEKISDGIAVQNSISNSLTQILSNNANRTYFTIFNSTDSNIYLDVANTLSLSSYMVRVRAGAYYESVIGTTSAIYALHDGLGSKSIQLREFS